MTADEKLLAIKEAISVRSRCMCSMWERCDWCDTSSALNKLRDTITEIIDGPRPKPTLEDYGKVVEIELKDIL